MKTLLVFVLGLTTLLTGCGGSGAKSNPDPAREVALRQKALMVRFKAGDAPGFLQFVADGYSDAYGANKPALSALVQADFEQFDTLALALTSQKFLVSSSGNSVQVEATYQITDREKADNDTQTYSITILPTWTRFGSTWLITSLTKPNATTQAAVSFFPWKRR